MPTRRYHSVRNVKWFFELWIIIETEISIQLILRYIWWQHWPLSVGLSIMWSFRGKNIHHIKHVTQTLLHWAFENSILGENCHKYGWKTMNDIFYHNYWSERNQLISFWYTISISNLMHFFFIRGSLRSSEIISMSWKWLTNQNQRNDLIPNRIANSINVLNLMMLTFWRFVCMFFNRIHNSHLIWPDI